MQILTVLLAVIGSLLVLVVSPLQGLIVYIISYLSYPYSAGLLSISTIDFSVSRIIIIVLVVRLIFATDLTRGFTVIWLDRLVVMLFAAEIAAGVMTSEARVLVENRLGDFCDMALPYLAVRLIVRTKEDYISLIKAVAWATAALSIVAFYESLTGVNLLNFGHDVSGSEVRLRYFHRAQVTFRHAIYFGVFSGMTGAVCLGLIRNTGNKSRLFLVLAGLVFLGAFSSMSSGGLLALVGAIGFVSLYRWRRSWRGIVAFVVIMCVLVEIVSNRHFYNVIDRFTFESSTAWYRARLFEVAFFEGGMSGHWLLGYGLADPGWGPRIDMRDHTDMVNHYLLELARYGLVGFIPFCLVIIVALKNLFRGFWSLARDEDTWLIWCVAGGFFSVLLAFNSVSLFEQPMIMLFMMFGFCVALPPMLLKKPRAVSVRAMGQLPLTTPGASVGPDSVIR